MIMKYPSFFESPAGAAWLDKNLILKPRVSRSARSGAAVKPAGM